MEGKHQSKVHLRKTKCGVYLMQIKAMPPNDMTEAKSVKILFEEVDSKNKNKKIVDFIKIQVGEAIVLKMLIFINWQCNKILRLLVFISYRSHAQLYSASPPNKSSK